MYLSDIESDGKMMEVMCSDRLNQNRKSVIQFTERMGRLNIGEEVNNMDTTMDNFESLRCREIFTDRGDNIPDVLTVSPGNDSYMLHYNILQSTNNLAYKNILRKPNNIRTPLGVMSMPNWCTKTK